MAIVHAQAGEVIDIRPLGTRFNDSVTSTLVKTEALEVLRLVLPAGTHIDQHQVPGDITVQCFEGQVNFDAEGTNRELVAGDLLFLKGATMHALRSVQDSSVLVTILLHHKSAAATA